MPFDVLFVMKLEILIPQKAHCNPLSTVAPETSTCLEQSNPIFRHPESLCRHRSLIFKSRDVISSAFWHPHCRANEISQLLEFSSNAASLWEEEYTSPYYSTGHRWKSSQEPISVTATESLWSCRQNVHQQVYELAKM